MKFLKLIERLEDLVLAGLNIPLTPWTMINNERLIPLLDRIREQLPDELREAGQLLAHRDQVIEEARRQSVRILHDAQSQAEAMVSESQLMAAIQDEANRVKSQLMQEGEAIRHQAMAEGDIILQDAREQANLLIDRTHAWATQTTRHIQSFLSDQLHASESAVEQLGLMPPSVERFAQGNLQAPASQNGSCAIPSSPTSPRVSKNGLPPLLKKEDEHALWANLQGSSPATPSRSAQEMSKMVSKSNNSRQKLLLGQDA